MRLGCRSTTQTGPMPRLSSFLQPPLSQSFQRLRLCPLEASQITEFLAKQGGSESKAPTLENLLQAMASHKNLASIMRLPEMLQLFLKTSKALLESKLATLDKWLLVHEFVSQCSKQEPADRELLEMLCLLACQMFLSDCTVIEATRVRKLSSDWLRAMEGYKSQFAKDFSSLRTACLSTE